MHRTRFIALACLAPLIWSGCSGSASRQTGTSAGTALPLQPGITDSLPRSPDPPSFFLDDLGPLRNPFERTSISLSSADEFRLRGWAADKETARVAGGVEVVIDRKPFQISYGDTRSDVADFFKNPALRNSGFHASFPASALGSGTHPVSLRVLSSDRKTYFQTTELTVSVR